MQRLVTYGSSDEEEASPPDCSPPPAKRRKLPGLPETLRPNLPVDNPALHQGRVRTSPHVEGQYAAYVYVPLILERGSPLHKLILKAFAHAKESVPSMHPIGPLGELNPSNLEAHAENLPDSVELHVSLTRPVYLRVHQREDLKRAVKTIALTHPPFSASLAAFSELTNDERTRTFLAAEVGAGHVQLKRMSDALLPTLRSLKQKAFYTEPRFHASFAWALLHRSVPSSSPGAPSPSTPTPESPLPPPRPTGGQAEAEGGVEAGASAPSRATADAFPTIARFPPTLVPSLNAALGERLRARHVGAFEVDAVHVKIGKDVFRWRLTGATRRDCQ